MVREGHHTKKKNQKWGKEGKALKKAHTGEESYTRREFKGLRNTFTCQALQDEGHSHFPNEDTKAQRDEGHTFVQGHTLSKPQ